MKHLIVVNKQKSHLLWKIEVIHMEMEGMRYTEALRKLNDVMQGREDIKEVKFDKENNMFEVVDINGRVHICFGDEFSK